MTTSAVKLVLCVLALLGGTLFLPADPPTHYPTLTPSPLVKMLDRVWTAIPAIDVVVYDGGEGRWQSPSGAGVVVDARGYVLTADHVTHAATQVSIRISNQGGLEAEEVATDRENDLALWYVKAKGVILSLPIARESPRWGEDITAIGHPLGYEWSCTRGVISGLNRDLELPTGYTVKKMYQTDASINPGNSGGPLLNRRGEIIGIISALREDSQGVNFVIPLPTVRRFLDKNLPRK